MKRFLYYNKNLKDRSKDLKGNMTKSEKKIRFDFFKKVQKLEVFLTCKRYEIL